MEIGDRMKSYENTARYYLLPRTPVIVRIDGKSFHTLTRKCEKPFDERLARCMDLAARRVLEETHNARFAYVQSDEISILLIDYNTFDTQQHFNGSIQKIASVSASIASVEFSKNWGEDGYFDARAFNVPEKEVVNYFIWRQQDSSRNSINMVASTFYSHKELQGKNCDERQEMIFQKGINWNDYSLYWKRGRVITREGLDDQIPLFTADRAYIEKFCTIAQL